MSSSLSFDDHVPYSCCRNCYLERMTKLSLSLGLSDDNHQPCLCKKGKGKMQQQSDCSSSSVEVSVLGSESRKSRVISTQDTATTISDDEFKLFGVLIRKTNPLKQQQGSSSSSNGDVDASNKRNRSQLLDEEIESSSCSTSDHAPAAAAADWLHPEKWRHINYYIDVAPLPVRPPQQIKENNPAADQFNIRKKLTKSDVNELSRLLLQCDMVKYCIEPHLSDTQKQDAKTKKGLSVVVKDLDTDSLHYLTLRKINSSGCCILIKNWSKKFVKRRVLCEGDSIGMFWDSKISGFAFSVLERACAPHDHQQVEVASLPIFSYLPLAVYPYYYYQQPYGLQKEQHLALN